MSTAAIIPAAGSGLRLGGGVPKALREVGGEPLLVHAVRGLTAAAVDLVRFVVAVPPGAEQEWRRMLEPHTGGADLTCVPGGPERADSVAVAVDALDVLDGVAAGRSLDCLLVHDAARPFVPADVVERVVAAVRSGAPAVVPVMPVTDTVKRVDGSGRVVESLDRSELVAVQTPQGFAPDVLRAAHRSPAARRGVTDDAMLVERLGLPVLTVEGSADSIKVTREHDLLVAEAILAGRTRS